MFVSVTLGFVAVISASCAGEISERKYDPHLLLTQIKSKTFRFYMFACQEMVIKTNPRWSK